jgi:hypothetical protein
VPLVGGRAHRQQRRMTPARALSLAVSAVALLRAWSLSLSVWAVLILLLPLLWLIWFPSQVDEYTFGLWYRGNRIDAHTPAFLISAFGWTFLLLLTVALCWPHAPRHPS